MSVFTLFLGCFILYGRSRFFPEHLSPMGDLIKNNKQVALFLGYLFILISYTLFANEYGWGTGFVLYVVTLSMTYGILITILSLHKTYTYIIALLLIILIISQNILH